MRLMTPGWVACFLAASLAACAATPDRFYNDRYSLGDTRLCRTFDKAARSGDGGFANDVQAELARRALSPERCRQLEHQQNVAIGAAAVVATAAVVLAHDNRHGGGGGGVVYVPPPIWITQPIVVAQPVIDDTEWDWDQFYRDGQLVWECRGVQTGRFAPPDQCAGLPMTDWRWPGK